MQKLIARIAGIALVLGTAMLLPSPLHAQETDLSGTWQGTLETGKGTRIVLKISKSAAARDAADAARPAWSGVFYSLDSYTPANGLATSSMTLQGANFTFAIPSTDGHYEGKLSPDGTSIAGTWDTGKGPQPLNLTHANAETAWRIPDFEKKMAPDANPGLEVATIKPTDPTVQGDNIAVNGRKFTIQNKTVRFMLSFAYGIHPRQILNAPDWFNTEKYDVDGVLDTPGQPSLLQMEAILQKLLADRFKLTFHHEKRDLSIYAITVVKTGPKLVKSLSDPNGRPNQNGSRNATGRIDRYTNTSMQDFAFILQFFLDRPVIDQTSLQGKFDFTLKWTPDDSPVADPTIASPGMFTAIQDELGLKLEPMKAPADVFVIDHVERPSAN